MAWTWRAAARALLPEGRGLPEDVWQRRHTLISVVLLAHVPVLYAYGLWQGYGPLHVGWEVALLLVAAAAGQWTRLPRVVRETVVGVGLLSGSALLVHLSGGYIEAHFHFFVMLPLVAMYQRWIPFLASVGFVALHHGVVGVLDPASVYNHPAALARPWLWAGIHAGFVLLECLALFRLWREVEDAQAAATTARDEATQLLATHQVKEHILRVASHELSTPLTPIKMQLHLMGKAGADDASRAAGMQVLERNFRRLERVVASVLDAVRLGNDAVHLNREEVDVARLARQSVATYDSVAESQGVNVAVNIRPAVAEVDAERVSQVLDNLLSNALKHTPRGGQISVTTQVEGPHVVLKVRDTGAGFDDDQRSKLFQPFMMVHRDGGAEGTGLGLYICKGIVEGHGGTMEAHSDGPGRGTCFTVCLPCMPPTQPDPAPDAQREQDPQRPQPS